MYFKYEEFNYIEGLIETQSIRLGFSYTPKTWVINEYCYIQEVDRIERAIKQLADFLKISIDYKEWLTTPSSTPLKNFSRVADYNRWLLNLELISSTKPPQILNIITEDEKSIITEDENNIVTEG